MQWFLLLEVGLGAVVTGVGVGVVLMGVVLGS
jgi:hypothetical protein